MYKAVDISTWQKSINWQKMKAGGIKGVIIRAGFGSTTTDNMFHTHIKNAIAAGMHIGIYYFSYAYTTAQAKAEAAHCLKIIEPYKSHIDLPVFFDWEYDSMNWARKHGVYPDRALITNMTKAFCQAVKAAGYKAGFYYNWDYKANHYNMDQLKAYYHWYALYTTERAAGADIQQYTSTGRVPGYNGNIDLNYVYMEEPAPDPRPDPNKLAVDGIFGYQSTKALQRFLRTPQDGTISGQLVSCKRYLRSWTAVKYDNGRGSRCIASLQSYLKARGNDPGTLDGYAGKKTIIALQRFLSKAGYRPGTIDGYFGPNTAKALQTFLNNSK